MFRVKEKGRYIFTLETDVEKGEIEAQVLGEKKDALLSFVNVREGEVTLSKEGKYYLQIKHRRYRGRYLF